VAIWQNQTLSPPQNLAQAVTETDRRVLGAASGPKWIDIDLTTQRLTAYQGDNVFLQTPISSGLWNKTPVGEYYIYYKITSTKMEGGSRLNHTYYYLPNVPYTMFFFGDFGIHGTYWHSNFGHPMSHGCVNTPTNIAEELFYWTGPHIEGKTTVVRASPDNPGTKVVIHY
jgi:lipoprotein-anchoring transpeptidase ErfK/SrfK